MTDYLIWSHQHNAWWRDGGHGYTTRLTDAGRFTRTQADQQLRWDEHREWLPDGRPHEVTVEALHPTLTYDILAPTVIAGRVEKATYEAIVERAGRAVRTATPTCTCPLGPEDAHFPDCPMWGVAA